MRIVHLSSPNAFEELRPDWNALLSTAMSNNVFLTWEWQSTWWRTYGRQGALRLLLAYDDANRLSGIAPLYRSSTYVGPRRFRTLEFVGGRHVASEYLDFIARSEVHGQVVGAFLGDLQRQRDWDLLVGHHTAAWSPTIAMLHDPSLGLSWMITDRIDNPYVPVPADWESYLAQLSKKTRGNINYYRNGAEKKLRATVCDVRDNIAEALPELVELHQKRMRQLGYPGSFASARFIRFHDRVARLFGEQGWGRLFALRVGDRLIAANYGFAYNGTFFDYSMGFDPAYKKHSIGFVLFTHMLERCIRDRLEVDFLDPGEFKELWNPERRQKVSYVVGASGRVLDAYGRASAARSFVVERVKRLLPAQVASRLAIWKDLLLSRHS